MENEGRSRHSEVSIKFNFAVWLFLKLVYWAMNYIHKFKRFSFLPPYCGVIDLTKYGKNRDLFSAWKKIYGCTRITGQLWTNNDIIYLNILSD